jgi:hypothetical protein
MQCLAAILDFSKYAKYHKMLWETYKQVPAVISRQIYAGDLEIYHQIEWKHIFTNYA